jgi:Tfp pilus assembly protein PilF
VKVSRVLVLPLLLLVAVSAFPANNKKVEEKLARANAEFGRHNIPGAERLIRQAIKEDPDSIEAHNMLADLLSGTGRYSQAATEYSQVLELDATQNKLSKGAKRRVVDGQAVAYAESGDLDRAKSIYLAAIKDDPDYAMYNYNLACVYAELQDLESAIPYLKKSWALRNTLPSDIKYPDPRQDSSFRAYLNDPRFQDAVRYMVQ